MDDVLELYYHCKFCAEPQAYLEPETFLDHMKQTHAEYIDDETEAGQKVFYFTTEVIS